MTENHHQGDLLGEFFEQIVAQDFTQSKGQFFTPVKVVRFMLQLCAAVDEADQTMQHKRDHLGRPRLPYVLDPSAGSGTFLIEYMKLVRGELGAAEVAQRLPRRVREAHQTWFSGSTGNAWARDFLFGIENNYDLGLAAKVNMVLHGDGSMNTWIASGLLPFPEYWVEGRHNLLGTVQQDGEHPYKAPRNEQFDLVISNPPFSVKLAPDEKLKIESTFDLMRKAQSEAIFIERWYQLLRTGGRFCCILPEAVLDTATMKEMRLFLLQYFQVEAVVSLPYDAFRPFTSTKTCILMARKRPVSQVKQFQETLAEVERELKGQELHKVVAETLSLLGWNDPIFMAEPETVGYKRRKNLPDLRLPNQLYAEAPDGSVKKEQEGYLPTVLSCFRAGEGVSDDPELGFWTDLTGVAARPGLRLDPKYRWLWDRMEGIAAGDPATASTLSSVLNIVKLPKVPKGELDQETRLIDLEMVESRQGLLRPDVPLVDNLGSEKVRFEGCDLAFSKLEPYLGKVLLEPDPADVGSTEWVGLSLQDGMPRLLAAYLLMESSLCEAYRRLQSGKRHARLDPDELLDLRISLPPRADWDSLVVILRGKRNAILALRAKALNVRDEMDVLIRERLGESAA